MIRFYFFALFAVWFVTSGVQVHAQILAFPGAEGFGRFAKGGRGGKVIHVTNLNSHGPGSFREALAASGPRTIVFDVSGIIEMQDWWQINNPFLTIAGQTAPGDGILLKGTLIFDTHDVIIRHMRIRPGPDVPVPGSHQTITFHWSSHTAIVDHCSLSWATDDTFGAGARDITLQWSIIADALNTAGFGKGIIMAHSHDDRVSVLHNLFANIADRTPQAASGSIQFVNNLVYNIHGDGNVWPVTSRVLIEFVKNYYLRGPHSAYQISTAIRAFNDSAVPPAHAAATKIYLKANYHDLLRPNNELPEDTILFQRAGYLPVVDTPLGFPRIPSETDALRVKEDVLGKAGAYKPKRSAADIRVINDVNNRESTAAVVYPSIPFVRRPADYDSDQDGMPDAWEKSHGLDPNNAGDSAQDRDNDGYTNLEAFLNEMAGSSASGRPQIPQNLTIR
jgi:pectate lyase